MMMFKMMSMRPFGAYPMMYNMAVIGDADKDCTLLDMQEKQAPEVEKRAALPDKMNVIEHWQKGWIEKVPAAGLPAPEGILHSTTAPYSMTTLHTTLRKLKAPDTDLVGLVFFNATCPVFNCLVYDVPPMFEDAGIPALYVYVAEFHNKDGVPSPMVAQIDMPQTLEERGAVAEKYGKPMLLDSLSGFEVTDADINLMMGSMDNSLEKSYEARPWRLFVINAATMTIGYKSGGGPMNCKPKLKDLTEYLKTNAPQ